MSWFRKKNPPQDDAAPDASSPPPAGPVPSDATDADTTVTGARETPDRSAPGIAEGVREPATKNSGRSEDGGGIFKRLRRGLARTRQLLTTDLDELFAENTGVGDEMLEDLEEILVTADIGVQTAAALIE
ncbi:MAG: signal recognition particle receptor subunit alpha, partial [Desulfobacterales bacterium]